MKLVNYLAVGLYALNAAAMPLEGGIASTNTVAAVEAHNAGAVSEAVTAAEAAAYKPQCKNWWTWFAFVGWGIIECSLEFQALVAEENRIANGGGKSEGHRKGGGKGGGKGGDTDGAHVEIITHD